MSTKHALLALLDVQPMSGYELAQNMKISLESLWAASFSQIYPTLHKLEQAGLVSSESTVRGTKMERIVYALTPDGHAELTRWLQEPVSYLPLRDPFMLWASYLDIVPTQRALDIIDNHLRRERERLSVLEGIARAIEQGEHPLTQVRRQTLESRDFDRLRRARSFVYGEMAAQVRFAIGSAERVRELAAELSPYLHADAP